MNENDWLNNKQPCHTALAPKMFNTKKIKVKSGLRGKSITL